MEFGSHVTIDLSASVNDAEYDLQRQGTAEALRDPDVQAAILSHAEGIAVSAVQWASLKYQRVAIPWTRLRTLEDIDAFADVFEVLPRLLPGGGTSLTGGLTFSAKMFASSPVIGRRRVIDIAANGRADNPRDMQKVRQLIVASGIVINALAIEELQDDLTKYFHQYVIGGDGAFVQTAWSFEDFRQAMRAKLLREIGTPRFSRHDQQDLGGESASIWHLTYLHPERLVATSR